MKSFRLSLVMLLFVTAFSPIAASGQSPLSGKGVYQATSSKQVRGPLRETLLRLAAPTLGLSYAELYDLDNQGNVLVGPHPSGLGYVVKVRMITSLVDITLLDITQSREIGISHHQSSLLQQ